MRLRIAWASLCSAAALAACTPPPSGPLARAGGTGPSTTGTSTTGATTTGTSTTTTDAAGAPDPTEAPRPVPMVGQCRAGQTWGCAPCVADSTSCPCGCVGAPSCPTGEALLVVADTVGCGRPTAVCHRTTEPAVFVCDRRPPPPPVPNRIAPADVRCTATPTGWEQRNLLRRADTPAGMPPSPTGVWCDLQGDGEHWGPRPDTPAAGPGRSAGYFCQVVKGSPDHGKVTCWPKDERSPRRFRSLALTFGRRCGQSHMRTNPWKLTSFALLAGLVTTTVIAPAIADRQPHMRGALVDMKKARAQLEQATPDKGGHRAKAIVLLKQAIDEVELGIKFDNQH